MFNFFGFYLMLLVSMKKMKLKLLEEHPGIKNVAL